MQKRYHRRVFLAAENLEEMLTSELWSTGALGCEIVAADQPGRLRIEAYFADPPPAFSPAANQRWASLGIQSIEESTFDDRDWLADYRAQSQPFEVGSFIVDPRDVETPPVTGPGPASTHLRIPAQTAFGTGSHESTQLTVECLEGLDLKGQRMLDVGTGSGILAFVAYRLGAEHVLGIDLDLPSVCIASANATLNDCSPDLVIGRIESLRPVPSFDLAVVNVLPERIYGDYPRLVEMVRVGGLVVSSGNLIEQRSSLLERYHSLGLESVREFERGEWLALVLRKVG